jgi:hypothetical protein
MRNPKNELHKQVLVHLRTPMRIVNPLLSYLYTHFFVAVERSEHAIDTGEEFTVLLFSNGIVIGWVLAFK